MLEYIEYGKKVPIILLHGFAGENSIWTNILSDLKEINVLCPNLPCIGKSIGDVEKISLEYVANKLSDWMEEISIAKAFILGHSMGGYITQIFAQRFPEKVVGIGLINSSPLDDSPEKINNRQKSAQFILNYGKIQFLSMSIPSWFAQENREVYKTTIQTLIDKAMQIPDKVLYQYQIAMAMRPSFIKWFENLNKPKLLVLGKNDELISVAEHEYLKSNQTIDYHVIPHCGHFAMIEQKEALIKSMITFVETYS